MDESAAREAAEFFDHWRNDRVASMTLVGAAGEGALFYYPSRFGCTVWVFASPASLIISYGIDGSGPQGAWNEALRLAAGAREATLSRSSMYPVYAAAKEPASGRIAEACHHPGDWSGLTNIDPLPVLWDELPGGWPEAYRSRLKELQEERILRAEASDSFNVVYPVARALVALRRYPDAERLLRRSAALCEPAAGSSNPNAARSLQGIAAVLAFQANYAAAEAAMRQALAAWILVHGEAHHRTASALRMLGRLLEHQGKEREARSAQERADTIEQTLKQKAG